MMLSVLLLKEMIIKLIFLYMSKDEAINLLRNADDWKKVLYYKAQKIIITYKNG